MMKMIETQFFILTKEQYNEYAPEAEELGMNLDYYLMEFCNTEGEWIMCE